MFSYRHAFHAGNHGDVLKHAVFLHVLDHYLRKDKAFHVIDTHAGAGLYALDGLWARQSQEADGGLLHLQGLAAPPPFIERYLQAVRAFNPPDRLNRYPGSPALALQVLRPQDRLHLFECHPREIDVLRRNLRTLTGRNHRANVYFEDGFNGLRRLLPVPTRRGIILIDPPYEDKRDYRYVIDALRDGLRRFQQGCFVVWHPLVQRVQAHEMARALERLPVDWLHATLTVRKPMADGRGLHGSGMFLVNPPYTLQAQLQQALPWVVRALAQDGAARWRLTTGPTPPAARS